MKRDMEKRTVEIAMPIEPQWLEGIPPNCVLKIANPDEITERFQKLSPDDLPSLKQLSKELSRFSPEEKEKLNAMMDYTKCHDVRSALDLTKCMEYFQYTPDVPDVKTLGRLLSDQATANPTYETYQKIGEQYLNNHVGCGIVCGGLLQIDLQKYSQYTNQSEDMEPVSLQM